MPADLDNPKSLKKPCSLLFKSAVTLIIGALPAGPSHFSRAELRLTWSLGAPRTMRAVRMRGSM
jgi:hypothetical protein